MSGQGVNGTRVRVTQLALIVGVWKVIPNFGAINRGIWVLVRIFNQSMSEIMAHSLFQHCCWIEDSFASNGIAMMKRTRSIVYSLVYL